MEVVPIILRPSALHIFVHDAGGMVSFALPVIIRYLFFKGIDWRIYLSDHSVVTGDDLAAGNFVPGDLGKSRSVVLMERYNSAFDLRSPRLFALKEAGAEWYIANASLILEITSKDAFFRMNYPSFWIKTGGSRVTLGSRFNAWSTATGALRGFPLSDPLEVAVSDAPSDLSANLLGAQLLCSLVSQLCAGEIKSWQFDFDADGRVTPYFFTERVLAGDSLEGAACG